MGKQIKVRMCIVCRARFFQNELIRLKFCKKNQEVIKFDGAGRSFYICKKCLLGPKIEKVFNRNFNLTKQQAKEKVKYLKGIYG